jgi:hypothetical protein
LPHGDSVKQYNASAGVDLMVSQLCWVILIIDEAGSEGPKTAKSMFALRVSERTLSMDVGFVYLIWTEREVKRKSSMLSK